MDKNNIINSIGLRHEVIAAALGVSAQLVRMWSCGQRAIPERRMQELIDLREAVRQIISERAVNRG